MTRKKNTDRSAPPLPEGEFYSMYDVPKENPFRGIVCTTHWRYFSTQEAIEKHIARHLPQDCEIKNFGRRIDGKEK